ncbi:hypothetical protein HWV62_11295 [Athelia sp. TMB]|nr:hypothetical protein HWV62_11295 [Athelia sp. TMB]
MPLQLTAADITFSIIRPLVFKYARLNNMATIYACMVVRSFFLGEAEANLAYSGVNISRASLCEILAMKLLGYYAENKIHLVAVLTTGWEPLAGAPDTIVKEVRQSLGPQYDPHDPQSALEMAVSTEAKAFLSSPVVQSIVSDIYNGRVVFSTSGHRSMLADNYKPREIEIYDCATAPFLNHYRLRVPRYSNILEFWNFSVLIVVLILCLSNENVNRINVWEGIFIVYATAFTLGEYTAANEHGWNIYIANVKLDLLIIYGNALMPWLDVERGELPPLFRADTDDGFCVSGKYATIDQIDSNANQEYLFQHAISTIEGVNSDALFSYQPPFNLLAFLLLKPASWILTPRALHSANVLLIKITSFPILIIISLYERHFAAGQRFRESSKGAAQSFYGSLPRRIRHIPFLEAMVGSNSRDLYDAIFEVEVSHDFELFDGEGPDDELPALRSRRPSRERERRSGNGSRRSTVSPSPARRRKTSLRVEMPGSPRTRKLSALSPLVASSNSTEVPGAKSPLTRLFSFRQSTPATPEEVIAQVNSVAVDGTLKKMESLLDEMRDLPVQRLKDEMKELQDRQARIESLLLMLTRGMRNDTGPTSSSSRQGTMS